MALWIKVWHNLDVMISEILTILNSCYHLQLNFSTVIKDIYFKNNIIKNHLFVIEDKFQKAFIIEQCFELLNNAMMLRIFYAVFYLKQYKFMFQRRLIFHRQWYKKNSYNFLNISLTIEVKIIKNPYNYPGNVMKYIVYSKYIYIYT